MERLSDAAINIINDLHKERLDYTSEYLPLIDALNRLAEYEDTKISPAVIKELYALAKLRVADVKDSAAMIGRLVILPCKVGDTVWFIGTECDKWNCQDYEDHCHIGCKKWKTPKIRETTIRQFRLFGDQFDSMTDTTALADSSSNYFHFRDIGKTVFLTKEEALKKKM